MTSGIFLYNVFDNNIDLVRDKIMVAPFDNKYSIDFMRDHRYGQFPFDVPAAKPKELSGKTVNIVNGCVRFDADDISWGKHMNIQANGALIFDSSKANLGVAFVDFGSNFTTTNGTFTITWDATGVFNIDLEVGMPAGPKTWELA